MDTQEEQTDATLAETLDEPQVQEQETKEAPEVQEEASTEEQVVEEPVKEEEDQKLRFSTIRAARERAERERDELRYRLDQIESQKKGPDKPKADEDFYVAPDDLVEGKHLSRYDKRMQKMEQEIAYQKEQVIVTRLKSKHPDFYSVVNKENMDMLREMDPEFAETLSTATNLYSAGITAYTRIMDLGISKEPQSKPTYTREHARTQKNASRPRPIASVNAKPGSDGPISRANAFAGEFTDDEKKQLYAEMQEAKRRR